MNFLSCENINLHKEYAHNLSLKLSVFEASYPKINNLSYNKISRLKMDRQEKNEVLNLKAEIEVHKLYFNSFISDGERCKRNEFISSTFGSEANFLYEIMCSAKDRTGFLIIYIDGYGKIRSYAGDDYINVLKRYIPKLAVDLCEHSYFIDYGFDKGKYLSSALSSLNLSVITPKIVLQNR